MQSVSVVFVDKSTVTFQCTFIHGSDALGCKVVLVSDNPEVDNETVNISRNYKSAQKAVNLTKPYSCYSRMFAFDIEFNGTSGDLTIEGQISTPLSSSCSGMAIIFIMTYYSSSCREFPSICAPRVRH